MPPCLTLARLKRAFMPLLAAPLLATPLLGTALLSTALIAPNEAIAGSRFEQAGDVLQLALPAAAALCAARHDQLAPFAGRLAGQIATTQLLKKGLDNSAINRRPNGGSGGFPSGHTGLAFYGASALARDCLSTPGQKLAVYSLATAVGASRISADKHTLGQVVAGAVLGVMFDRVSVTAQGDRTGVSWRHDF